MDSNTVVQPANTVVCDTPEADALAAAHPFHRQLEFEIPDLERHALYLTRNRGMAQDLVQETLMKAWSKRAGYANGSSLGGWLHTILRNTFISQFRRQRLECRFLEDHASIERFQPPSQFHAVALNQARAAIAGLPRRQHETLLLVGVAGLSNIEAAARLNCPTGTVKSRLSRARATLRDFAPSE